MDKIEPKWYLQNGSLCHLDWLTHTGISFAFFFLQNLVNKVHADSLTVFKAIKEKRQHRFVTWEIKDFEVVPCIASERKCNYKDFLAGEFLVGCSLLKCRPQTGLKSCAVI